MNDVIAVLNGHEFAKNADGRPVPVERYEQFAGVLPDAWLDLWRQVGFAGFNAGVVTEDDDAFVNQLWITDPVEWQPAVDAWNITSRKLVKEQQLCLMRSAFGQLVCWSPSNGFALQIVPSRWRYAISNGYRKQFSLPNPDAMADSLDEFLRMSFGYFWGNVPDGVGSEALRYLTDELGPVDEQTMFSYHPSMREGGHRSNDEAVKVPAVGEIMRLAGLGPATEVSPFDLYELPDPGRSDYLD